MKSFCPSSTATQWSLMILLGLGTLLALPLGADELVPGAPDAPLLEPTIVTATRTEERRIDVPNTTYWVDEQQTLEQAARTLPETLEETPGIMVQKTSNGQGSPFIRGFTGFRNLLLIDGVRLNHSAFRDGPNQYWSTVDSYSLTGIEVVPGQGSVLYGSDAIGGTVNVLTKGPDLYAAEAGQSFTQGRGIYRWSSGEQSHVGRVEGSVGQGERMGLHFGYSQKRFGKVRAAEIGEQSRTGYDEWALDSKFVYWFNPDLRLTLAYQQVQQNDVWRSHRTIYGKSWEGTNVGNEQRRLLDQDRQLAYLKLEADQPVAFVDHTTLTLSWQRHEEARDRIRRVGDDRRDIQGFDLDAFGLSLQMASNSPIGDLTYGLSYYRDQVDSFRNRFLANGTFDRSDIQGPVADDATYDLFGVYAQDKLTPHEDLDLWLGGRYTHARADADRVRDPTTGQATSLSDSWEDASFSLRGLWRPLGDDQFQIFGGVSQGFRAPNLSDLTRLDSARSNEIETPAPGLEPEEFLSFELGARVNRDVFSASLAYFYTDIDDMIVRAPTGRMIDGDFEVTKRNAGDGFVHGLELEAHWEMHPEWTLFGNVTWMDGEVDTFPTSAPTTEEEPLSRLMPPTGLIGLRYQPSDRWWLEVQGQFASKQDELSTRDRGDTQRIPPGGTPGYALLNVRSGWNLTENLALHVALENLTDEAYRVHGSGQNEPGFNAVLSLDARF